MTDPERQIERLMAKNQILTAERNQFKAERDGAKKGERLAWNIVETLRRFIGNRMGDDARAEADRLFKKEIG